MASSTLHTLLTTPSPNTTPNPPAALDPSEQAALASLINHFSSDLTLPTSEGKDPEPLSDWEKCSILSKEGLLRALRADRWDWEKSKKRLEDAITWRRAYGAAGFDFTENGREEIAKVEGLTGKLFVLGFDNTSRPILHMRPRHQNTPVTPARLQYTFWMMDRTIDLMPRGQEKMLLVIDLGGPQEKPAFKLQMEFLRVLSNYYFETLGKAIVLEFPFALTLMFKILKPLIDPTTYAKISFDKGDVLKTCPAEQIDAHVGGASDYKWDAEPYWPELIQVCKQRRTEKLERWRKMGGGVGLSEWEDHEAAVAPTSGSVNGDAAAVADSPETRVNTPDVNEKKVDGVNGVDASAPNAVPA